MANLKEKHRKNLVDIETGYLKVWCDCGDWLKTVSPADAESFLRCHPTGCRISSPVVFQTVIGTGCKCAFPVTNKVTDLDHPVYMDINAAPMFDVNGYDTTTKIINGEIDPRPVSRIIETSKAVNRETKAIQKEVKLVGETTSMEKDIGARMDYSDLYWKYVYAPSSSEYYYFQKMLEKVDLDMRSGAGSWVTKPDPYAMKQVTTTGKELAEVNMPFVGALAIALSMCVTLWGIISIILIVTGIL